MQGFPRFDVRVAVDDLRISARDGLTSLGGLSVSFLWNPELGPPP